MRAAPDDPEYPAWDLGWWREEISRWEPETQKKFLRQVSWEILRRYLHRLSTRQLEQLRRMVQDRRKKNL